MAKMNSEKRDANLAACVVSLAWLLERQINGEIHDHKECNRRLQAIQEIGLQCVDAKQEEEFRESLAAIESYNPPDQSPADQGQPDQAEK